MSGAGCCTEDNNDVQYRKAQVDATVEELTARKWLCVAEPWNFSND